MDAGGTEVGYFGCGDPSEILMSGNGIHHVTAIAVSARRNLDFYTRVLGLRLVKKTVNFDDPRTYHFYYGDEAGTPGTILTFFPWEHAAQGRVGIGETMETSFRVPRSSIGYWTHRFLEKGVPHEAIGRRFDRTVLAFRDPDGVRLALVGIPEPGDQTEWKGADIPAENAIRGFDGVTLLLRHSEPTAAILTGIFGFIEEAREGSLIRFRTGSDPGSIVDIRAAGDFLRGRQGAGSVHHVAFRAADDEAQFAMQRKLAEDHGIQTTEQKDRNYFRSLYFREPGGVLFEIATDSPGFTIDEAPDQLGQALKLPKQYERERRAIEIALPQLDA
jgi:glyoxalase family protein